jgi:hypothetical protein
VEEGFFIIGILLFFFTSAFIAIFLTGFLADFLSEMTVYINHRSGFSVNGYPVPAYNQSCCEADFGPVFEGTFKIGRIVVLP